MIKLAMRRLGIEGYVFHGSQKSRACVLAGAGRTTERMKTWKGDASDQTAAYYANQMEL
ncbi:MAG: hypothetical protein CFH05_01082, partial [Alphaproteobacteria bacterium MarineAlpha3_Bin4]